MPCEEFVLSSGIRTQWTIDFVRPICWVLLGPMREVRGLDETTLLLDGLLVAYGFAVVDRRP